MVKRKTPDSGRAAGSGGAGRTPHAGARGCVAAVFYGARCVLAAGVSAFLFRASILLPDSLPGMTRNSGMAALGGGLLFGIVLFGWVVRLPGVYVFGHELTHWFAALVFRRRTRGFQAGTRGGGVVVERPNIWITLAPYFVPIYTLLWIGLYGFYCLLRGGPPPGAAVLVYGGTGLTYAFHVVWTARALRMGQSDLQRYGVLFSLLVIFACNLAFMYVGVVVVTGGYRAGVGSLAHAAADFRNVSLWVGRTMAGLAAHGIRLASGRPGV